MARPAADLIEDLVDLYSVQRTSRGRSRAPIDRMIKRRAADKRRLLPKTTAAKILGVSVPTLTKWIARGKIRAVRDPDTHVERVDAVSVAQTLVYVREIREAGKQDGVLAAAILRLEQEDPQFQREFDRLYGDSLRAADAGELQSLVVPPSFGPDD